MLTKMLIDYGKSQDILGGFLLTSFSVDVIQ